VELVDVGGVLRKKRVILDLEQDCERLYTFPVEFSRCGTTMRGVLEIRISSDIWTKEFNFMDVFRKAKEVLESDLSLEESLYIIMGLVDEALETTRPWSGEEREEEEGAISVAFSGETDEAITVSYAITT